jgi:hypothetical protein
VLLFYISPFFLYVSSSSFLVSFVPFLFDRSSSLLSSSLFYSLVFSFRLLFPTMLSRFLVLAALCAGALGAPTLTYSTAAAEVPAEMEVLSDYFQLLASKVLAGKNMAQAPVCDLNKAVMPAACKPFPLPRFSCMG